MMKATIKMWRMTRLLTVTLAFFLALIGPKSATATEPSIAEACTLTVNDYAWHLDHPGLERIQSARDFANLFTRDAELTLPDDNLDLKTHLGHAAIAENYLESLEYTRLLHRTSNIRITRVSGSVATGRSYLTIYMHAEDGSMKDEGAITMVVESRDEYRITADGCKISKRKSVVRLLSTDGIIQVSAPE
jgi:hypothetical protein